MIRPFMILVITSLLISCTKDEGVKHRQVEKKTGEMSLTQQLEQKAKASAEKAPEDVKKIMSTAIAELKASSIMKSALKKGDKLPEFALKDVQRGEISSKALLKNGPIVLTFYRGGWCPYCNLQLRDLQKHLSEFKAAGAELVAISPEKPDGTAETVKKEGLDFFVLSDPDGKVGKQFGLMFKLTDELKSLYQKFGIDLEKVNDNKDWELPLAATYIVNQQGEIIYSFVDADYKKRAETKELVKIVQEI